MKMRITPRAVQILRDVRRACEAHDILCQDSDGDVCIFRDTAKGCLLKDAPKEWRIYDNISET